MEPRVKLYMPKEESFLVPLNYIDVTRNTFSSLDVMLEKNIDDYWNVDGDRDLSDTWTGFTVLKEKPPDGSSWSGERLTRNEKTSRPDNVQICGSVRLMQRNGKRSKSGLSRNQNSTMPDNLEEYSSFEPNDEEFKLTIKAARRKLEGPMPAGMPCKTPKNSGGETYCCIGKSKTKHA